MFHYTQCTNHPLTHCHILNPNSPYSHLLTHTFTCMMPDYITIPALPLSHQWVGIGSKVDTYTFFPNTHITIIPLSHVIYGSLALRCWFTNRTFTNVANLHLVLTKHSPYVNNLVKEQYVGTASFSSVYIRYIVCTVTGVV